ncbi:hypothetical protein [Rhizobium leguminosarum]|uniref:hypothetical protein n=1 Tax=Rhizobium leguminosarum TaxID=384 RepID=UPI0011AE43B3|nr:hypothetical protein [Rhizobium leguminosarum]
MAFIGVFLAATRRFFPIIACGRPQFQYSIPSFLLMHPSLTPQVSRTNIAAAPRPPAFSCFRISGRDLSLTRLAAGVFAFPDS